MILTQVTAAETEINPLVPHVPEIILGFIVIAILFVGVAKFIVPNFEKAYADRTAAIEGGMNEAKQAQAEAKAALDKYNAQLAEARSEAAKIREDAREQGAQIIAEMREQAQVEAGRIVEHAHAQISAERQHAVTTLRAEVGALATSLAERIVGESLEDDERSGRVVDRFLADLETLETSREAAQDGGR